MHRDTTALYSIRRLVGSRDARAARAMRIAEAIQQAGGYRWVGIYDVDDREIAVLGWSGAGCPTTPRFPLGHGLNGAAVDAKEAVVVNDVTADPRYLVTFDSTLSEIVVPVIDPASGSVLGTIDVESEELEAFGAADQSFLEQCASAVLDLWTRGAAGGT